LVKEVLIVEQTPPKRGIDKCSKIFCCLLHPVWKDTREANVPEDAKGKFFPAHNETKTLLLVWYVLAQLT